MERIDNILATGRSRLLAFAFVSMVVVSPTFFLGVYDGPDIPQHFQFADTYERAIKSGDLYPSWAAHENLGYGSVGVRFYPPLFSFVLAVAHMLTSNWHLAICLVFFLLSLVGVFGAYLFAKEFVTPERAFWAGIAFALMPYHLTQIYNISVYAEFAGCCVLPYCFLFATRTCRQGAFADIVGLAASYSILILTHLPSAVTGSVCLLIYGVVSISKGRAWATLLKLALASFLGLLASSAYWLRMVTELQWMQHTKFHDERVFDYTYNFLLMSNVLDGSPYPLLNAVLVTTLLAIGFAVWGLYAGKEAELLKKIRGPIVLFLVSVFMTLKISQPIWKVFPFIQTIQFPFRWLTVAVPAGAVIIACAVKPLYSLSLLSSGLQRTIKNATAVVATGLVFVFSVTWMNATYSFPSANFDEWVENKISAKGLDFWWTTITRKEAFDIQEKVTANGRQSIISEWQPYGRRFELEAGDAGNARVATLFYPHWKAEVNGNPASIVPDENGAILIAIPEQKSRVSLSFEEPTMIKAATAASVLLWVSLLVGCALWMLRRRVSSSPDPALTEEAAPA